MCDARGTVVERSCRAGVAGVASYPNRSLAVDRILIIEDSASLRRTLTEGLKRASYAVTVADNGEEGAWQATSGAFDVVVLDLMLPRMSGLDVLARIRRDAPDTQVLILSARDTTDDRVRGLDAGADDYLVKPFAFAELLARVRALVRRRYHLASERVTVGNVTVDLRRHEVFVDQVGVELAPRELALLELLTKHRGEVVRRAEIEACVYDEQVQPMSNVVDSAVSLLRRALRQAGATEIIHTRRGLGYVLDDPRER